MKTELFFSNPRCQTQRSNQKVGQAIKKKRKKESQKWEIRIKIHNITHDGPSQRSSKPQHDRDGDIIVIPSTSP